jgi:hypothetical protein
VRRADAVEPFFTFDVDPPAFNTTTGKRESMCTFAVDNSEFHIAIVRRGIYQAPFHSGITHHRLTSRFDLNHLATKFPLVVVPAALL